MICLMQVHLYCERIKHMVEPTRRRLVEGQEPLAYNLLNLMKEWLSYVISYTAMTPAVIMGGRGYRENLQLC